MRRLLILLFICYARLSAEAAINFVQSTTATTAGTVATSLSTTLLSPTGMGNLLVIYVVPGSSQPGTISVTDTGGNVYTPVTSTLTTGQCGIAQEFFYSANIAGGNDTITVTTANTGDMAVAVMEYSGIATRNPLDVQASTAQTGCSSTTSVSSAPVTTSNPNELIVTGAASATGLVWTPNNGYALRTGATQALAAADQNVSAAGAYSPSFNLSAPATWIESALAFVPAGRILCGQPDDLQSHLPPNWDTFIPPGSGQSYIDPVFGCRVKRLTNSSADDTTWDGKHLSFMHYYSTFTPINGTDTMLFVISDDGNWRIKDLNGNDVVPSANTPIFAGHPVWDATKGNVFYFASYNTLFSGTVNGNTVQETPLHTFGEYSSIVSPDSADLSQDGDHIALAGQNADNTMDIFVWSLSQQTKTSVYKTTCTNSGGAMWSQPGCLHKLQLTADNLLSIGFMYDGPEPENGIRLWTGGTLVHLQDKTDHYDTGNDLLGNSVFIAVNNSATLSNLINPCPSTWGLDVRPLSSMIAGQPTTSANICLLDHPQYWDVSYRGGVTQPWVALSFFDARPQGPEFYSNDPNYQVPPTQVRWEVYEDEVVLAKIDASAVYRLAYARSRSREGYWAQPRAALSRDGKYVVFTSNMAYPNGCPSNMHVPGECLDVYLINVQQ